MPFIGIGLHVLAAIFFAVHAVRSGQNLYWLLLLFMFPLLGSVVYFLAIYFPEIRHSRGARQVTRTANQLINPGRELREAREQLAHAPTLQNRIHLATLLLDSGQAQEARPLFEQAASSPLGDEPHILTALAQARLESGEPLLAVETLEGLFARRPEMRRKPQPALLYAEALAAAGSSGARKAFEHAVDCGNEPAARCRYADWLMTQTDAADREQARTLFAGIVEDARQWTRFAHDHNAPWLERAKAAMKGA